MIIVILIGIISFLWMAVVFLITMYQTTRSITFTDYLFAMIILAVALFAIVGVLSVRIYFTEKELEKLEEKYIKTF